MIKTIHLMKRYGAETGLDPLDLEIPKGEIFCVIGPNGAGKSTLLGLLGCILRPSGGEAYIDGYEISGDRKMVQRTVGVVPQNTYLPEKLTGMETLLFFASMYGLDEDMKLQRALELSEEIGIGEIWDRRTESYSKGNKQRLSVAISLLHKPKVLIMDEPLEALDINGRNIALRICSRIKNRGGTIVIASHDIDEMALISDRIGIMNKGKMVRIFDSGSFFSSNNEMRVIIDVYKRDEKLDDHVIEVFQECKLQIEESRYIVEGIEAVKALSQLFERPAIEIKHVKVSNSSLLDDYLEEIG